MRQNFLQHALAILGHLVVPKAKPLPTLARQISVTDRVAKTFCVLRAVSLDNQLSLNAEKVDDVGSKRDLPAKLDAIQAAIAQETPKAKLGVSRHAAHGPSAGALARRDAEISFHRSSIGGKALIRRFAPPSPRGRRGSHTDVRLGPVLTGKGAIRRPSPSGRRW